jgi:hypothetical protein
MFRLNSISLILAALAGLSLLKPVYAQSNADFIIPAGEEWLIIIWIFTLAGFLILLFLIFHMIYIPLKSCVLRKRLLRQYNILTQSQKDEIDNLKELIKEGLNADLAGAYKAGGIWDLWSKEERRGLEGLQTKKLVGLWARPYEMVHMALENAETALRKERGVRMYLERREEKSDEKAFLAALVWGLHWREEVQKAKERKWKETGTGEPPMYYA